MLTPSATSTATPSPRRSRCSAPSRPTAASRRAAVSTRTESSSKLRSHVLAGRPHRAAGFIFGSTSMLFGAGVPDIGLTPSDDFYADALGDLSCNGQYSTFEMYSAAGGGIYKNLELE